ncbi:hypothetical protein A1Q2_02512 [Trichosporon asahii var. asahii CBS 8904]|uniref:OTU domain-containing protein n=1 Tax=Trichosporon asahii var. asahii (strain CBS 8904) TaxID=1220162 RepID=K1VRJ3_TRIAC|nr:hypothetical protein A1Q2_02512 [Trichosporon asahii var. asahii CBS 8904]
MVRLSSHAPKRRQASVDNHDEEGDVDDVNLSSTVDNFMLLAESSHQLWVDPLFKVDFFQELKKWRTVQPAQAPWVSTYGNIHLPVVILVNCLKAINCQHIILKEYGQKLPLLVDLLGSEPAPPHPLSTINIWDIGMTFKSPVIFLFAPVDNVDKTMQSYPMVIPGSLDYGSLLVDINYAGQQYRVKIYPRLVHVIKSFNSRLQGEPITSLFGLRRRLTACDKMIHNINSVNPLELGGFRIEVTVNSPTLAAAKQHVDTLPFFNINWWINPPQAYQSYAVDIKVLPKSALVDNARWVYQRAVDLKLISGGNTSTPTRRQKQVSTDVLAALGWNAGKGRPTKSLSSTAWWRGQQSTVDNVDRLDPFSITTQHVAVLNWLTRSYSGKVGIRRLLKIIRAELGCVPCQQTVNSSAHVDQVHGYHVWAWSPFRLRCVAPSCQHNLYEAGAFRWFAQLVNTGQLTRQAIGMSTLPATEGDDIINTLTQPDVDQSTVDTSTSTYDHLVNTFKTKDTIKGLLAIARGQLPGRRLQCQVNSQDDKHRYNIHGWNPFRMRCAVSTCHHNMTHTETFNFIAQLVDSGQLTRESVCLPPLSINNININLPPPVNTLNLSVNLLSLVNSVPSQPSVPVLYKTNWIRPDGSCMFSAIAKAMGALTGPNVIRTAGIVWMREHSEQYQLLMEDDMSLDTYLDRMSDLSTFGDHAILHALCQLYQLSVVILKVDNGESSWLQVSLEDGDPEFVIWLHLTGEHYENLLTERQVKF